MIKGKTVYSVQAGDESNSDSYGAASFILKSVGAALCGATIPAIVFYFLF